ncbi:hypothetical protein AXG93_1543s1100 [Marchantia polymorpha subsp. ruderalis]|uniref:Uncharacterized protein n=1 Tax=Marchantia polymorpha subsp. ruderalis TaxID=1480154 RepID=A0A176VXE9_MARPO|nr:hypothetical protein AXG93_1543s1100 [Marchantia polymorpha subsp. ruderalis]
MPPLLLLLLLGEREQGSIFVVKTSRKVVLQDKSSASASASGQRRSLVIRSRVASLLRRRWAMSFVVHLFDLATFSMISSPAAPGFMTVDPYHQLVMLLLVSAR